MKPEKNNLRMGLESSLEPYQLNEEEMDLVYSCFVCANAEAKYIPGYRLIMLVYKLTSILTSITIQKDTGKL